MRHIDFDPSKLTGEQKAWWDLWTGDAEQATADAIAAWERGDDPPLDQTVWTRLKDWLLENVFNGKCAYCESKLARSSYHAEHFRPKGRVAIKDPATQRSQLAKTVDGQGRQIDHPGYFWLAYNWKNLLPSCEGCNTRRGKHDQLPLAAGRSHLLLKRMTGAERDMLRGVPRASGTWRDHYYLDPDDLDVLERPLLLHPYRDEPREHLRFTEFGLVHEVNGSEKGMQSIGVYDLIDNKLNEERREQQERAYNQFHAALGFYMRQGMRQAIQRAHEALEGFSSGKEAYSAAALDYVDDIIKELHAV